MYQNKCLPTKSIVMDVSCKMWYMPFVNNQPAQLTLEIRVQLGGYRPAIVRPRLTTVKPTNEQHYRKYGMFRHPNRARNQNCIYSSLTPRTFGVDAEVRNEAVEAPFGLRNQPINQRNKLAANQLALLPQLCPAAPVTYTLRGLSAAYRQSLQEKHCYNSPP